MALDSSNIARVLVERIEACHPACGAADTVQAAVFVRTSCGRCQYALFRPRPELGIARAAVREIMVRVSGPEPCKLSIFLGATASDDILHRRLQVMLHDIRPSLLQVERVRTHVEFERNAEGGRLEPCTFELRTPNSCNLKDDARGFLIQRMLEEHGVELRQPAEESADGARLL